MFEWSRRGSGYDKTMEMDVETETPFANTIAEKDQAKHGLQAYNAGLYQSQAR